VLDQSNYRSLSSTDLSLCWFSDAFKSQIYSTLVLWRLDNTSNDKPDFDHGADFGYAAEVNGLLS